MPASKKRFLTRLLPLWMAAALLLGAGWFAHAQEPAQREGLVERVDEPASVVVQAMAPDDFLLPPLPNHLFTRDTSAWIFDGVSINSMRKRARMRETIHYEAIYRWHPHFADSTFRVWAEGSVNGAATTEGGDILVLGRGAVLVGMLVVGFVSRFVGFGLRLPDGKSATREYIVHPGAVVVVPAAAWLAAVL